MSKRVATDHKGNLRRFFSPAKVAESLGCHKRTVLRMVKRRELEAYQPAAGLIRIPADEVERLLTARSIGKPVES